MSHATLRGLVAIFVVAVVILVTGGGAAGNAVAEVGWHPHLLVADAGTAGAVAQATPVAGEALSGSPVMVIENAGQWPESARFQVWGGPAGTMWLADDAIWLSIPDAKDVDTLERSNVRTFARSNVETPSGKGTNIRVTFAGANPHPRLEPVERLATKVSYFLGDDPAGWHTEVPVWGGVRYVDLYPGVDLVVGAAGEARTLWALQTQDGADTSAVKVNVEGAEGAAIAGGLVQLDAAETEIRLPLPRADFSYTVNESVVAGLGAEQTIVREVDAQGVTAAGNAADLLYSTFLGGGDEGDAIAVDASGRAYVTGWAGSSGFPTTPGAFDRSFNGSGYGDGDAFVARLNASGSALDYATFLGGTDGDGAVGIAVDASGRAYVTGWTFSGNFPTTAGAFDRSYNGGRDAFVVRLNASGSALDYATFLGGYYEDSSRAIALDGSGQAYVTGGTSSNDFPTTPGAFNRRYVGGQGFNNLMGDAFAARLNAAGTALSYSTYLSGAGGDYSAAITVDASGRAYVTGATNSDDFPTTPGAFDTTFNGPCQPLDPQPEICISLTDVFVIRLNASGSTLEYSTLLGGNGDEVGSGVAVDPSGRAYVTGWTVSSDFPATPGAFDRSHNGHRDAFVLRLSANGSALDYSTYLGGSGGGWFIGDTATGIAIDGTGRAYVTGWTDAPDFPTTADAVDRDRGGCYIDNDSDPFGCGDAFAVRLNANGTALEYSTYLGGSGSEYGPTDDYSHDIALDASARAYITGRTVSSDFPTTPGAFDRIRNGYHDAFVTKLAMGAKIKTFQNNVAPIASYSGNTDVTLVEAHPSTRYSIAAALVASGSDPAGTGQDKWALFKWDLVSLSGWVQAAWLTLNVTDSSSGQNYELYEALGNWYETTAAWNSKPAKGTTVLGVVAPTETGPAVVTLNAAGLAVVQNWLNTPTKNYGFYLMDSANTDTLRFDSSEQTTPTLRPKLTVTYLPPVITRGPWVESISATTANVLWETDIYAKGNINYRVQGATAWTNRAVITNLVSATWQAKAVLAGLAPNTTYEYRVRASADSAWSATASFKTAAAGPEADAGTVPEDGAGSGTIFLPLLRQ